MKLLAVLGVSVLLAASEPQSKEKGGKLPWKKDFAAGLKTAKQKGMPSAVYFTSSG